MKKLLRQLLLAACVLSAPLIVLLLDLPADVFAGCGGYGYSCQQPVCFGLEVTTDSGSTWKDGSVTIYGAPGTQVSVTVRTVISVSSGNSVQGWSFSVRPDASPLLNAGGNFEQSAAEESGLTYVNCGSPPDFEDTRLRPCGYTQGVVLDTGGSGCELTGPALIVTSEACFDVTFPSTQGIFPVTLAFTDDIGDPPVQSIAVRAGQSEIPCKFDLTLNLYSTTSYYPTPSYCPLTPQTPLACGGGGGGASGGGAGGGAGAGATCEFFVRGDADASGTINITDPIFTLDWLFLGGPILPCLDAGDADDNGALEMTDSIVLLGYLFLGSDPPELPFPGCGIDVTPDGLTCGTYPPCAGFSCVDCSLPPFRELQKRPDPAVDPPYFDSELMATKEIVIADLDSDGDLDFFVPESRGGNCQQDRVYINRIGELAFEELVVDTTPVNNAQDDHDGVGNSLLLGSCAHQNCNDYPANYSPPNPTEPLNTCSYENSYSAIVADIGAPGQGPCNVSNEVDPVTDEVIAYHCDGLPDIVTINGSDFMRILIAQPCTPVGCFPSFVDEAGKVEEVLDGTGNRIGWEPAGSDSSKRIYNDPNVLNVLGPLESSVPEFAPLQQDLFASLDDVDAGDIDLDGDLDLVASNRDSHAPAGEAVYNLIFRNKGTRNTGGGRGEFELFEFIGQASNLSTHDVHLGDYDNDGDLDLVMSHDNAPPTGPPQLWRNRAKQMQEAGEDPASVADPVTLFDDVSTLSALPTEGGNHFHASFVDFNNDGFLDIHIGGSAHENEHGEEGAGAGIETHSMILWSNADPTDKDGDGVADVTFTAVGIEISSYQVGYADFNGDRFLDIATASGEFGAIYLSCEGPNGQRTFVLTQALPLDGWNVPLNVATGDINGDGKPDVAISQGDGGNVIRNRIFLNTFEE